MSNMWATVSNIIKRGELQSDAEQYCVQQPLGRINMPVPLNLLSKRFIKQQHSGSWNINAISS